MLFLLPFYAMKLTERSHPQVVNMSWRVPVLVFCFSPYCGHCKEIHPDWTKAAEEFKNDPAVIMGEIDCFEFHSICSKFHHVQGYPSFTTILKGLSKAWDGERDYSGFKSYAEKLKRLKMDELCPKFSPSNKSGLNFPAIVMSHPGNHKQSCAIIDKITYQDNFKEIIPHFYADPGKDKISFEYYLDNETKVLMNKSYSVKAVHKFIREYQTPNFEPVKWDVVFSHSRPLCIVVTKDNGNYNDFKALANKTPKFFWASVTSKRFKELAEDSIVIDDNSLPAIFVSNEKKNKYVLVANATTENIVPYLQGNFNDLKGIKHKRLSFIFRDLILFPGKKINRKAIMVGAIAAVVIFICVVCYNICYDPYYKFE